jgi:hypothetical protein
MYKARDVQSKGCTKLYVHVQRVICLCTESYMFWRVICFGGMYKDLCLCTELYVLWSTPLEKGMQGSGPKGLS